VSNLFGSAICLALRYRVAVMLTIGYPLDQGLARFLHRCKLAPEAN